MGKKRLRIILDVVAWTLVLLGLVLIFFTTGAGGLGAMKQDAEVPLGSLDAIAVDKNGNVYCATHMYDRIQVYDNRGRFLRGLYVPMTAFRFIVDSDGCVQVWNHYDQYKKFGPNGEVLSEDPKHIPKFAEEPRVEVKRVVDAEGSKYIVPWYAWCWPVVVKETVNGSCHAVVSQPLYLWLIKVGCPAWFYVVLSVIYLNLVKFFRRYLSRGDLTTGRR